MLKLNDSKTEVLIIVPPSHSKNYVSRGIRIADAVVVPGETARSLGFVFDSNLTLGREIENRCRVLLFHLRNIRSIRRFLTQSACEKLVHALISSRLDYANSMLVGIPQKRLRQLQMMQNIAARIVTQTRKYDRITPILITLHWLPVKVRIDFKIITLTFKIIHGFAPGYLCDLIKQRETPRCLGSSSKIVLVIPKTRTKSYGDRAFSVAAPKLWNTLPLYIQNVPNYDEFKNKLKTYEYGV